MGVIKKYLNNFVDLFFPNLCAVCSDTLLTGEDFICSNCYVDIPKTNFHKELENPVAQLFWGRANVETATAYYYFKKGSKYQKVIHKLKYKGEKEIGIEIGKLFGADLNISEYYQYIDVIIPVPLHKSRLKERGFNQSEYIAMGMSESMEKPMDINSLIRTIATSTQTKKNRLERVDNVASIFKVENPSEIYGKHILLIDDVITTGATLESCANTLLDYTGVKVSIAAIGFSSNN